MAVRMLPNPTRPFFRIYQFPHHHVSSDFSHLHKQMVLSVPLFVTNDMSPDRANSLQITLRDFLPQSNNRGLIRSIDNIMHGMALRSAHHLVYFPLLQTTSKLLPDGTDTWHHPGPPFTRRMWVGGDMEFRQSVILTSHPFHCAVSVKDVQVRGNEGQEKVFVKVQHAIYPGRHHKNMKHDPSEVHIVENRTLLFMRDRLHDGSPTVSDNVLRPTQRPDYSHTIIPTRQLLFRFSALTFNAHAIHLDKTYCREVEGHRNLLVHGPLTVLLMLEVLQFHLRTLSSRSMEIIIHVEYKNLAPLYAEEQMRICVRRKDKYTPRSTWDVWIEGRDGGYAVKGTVKTFLTEAKSLRSTNINDSLHERILGEHIPQEDIALQNEINATHEVVTNENGTLGEDASAEEKTEFEAKEEV